MKKNIHTKIKYCSTSAIARIKTAQTHKLQGTISSRVPAMSVIFQIESVRKS